MTASEEVGARQGGAEKVWHLPKRSPGANELGRVNPTRSSRTLMRAPRGPRAALGKGAAGVGVARERTGLGEVDTPLPAVRAPRWGRGVAVRVSYRL